MVLVKRVKYNRIAISESIEKYLDGCVKILSLGRFFFLFFFFFFFFSFLFLIKALLCLKVQKTHAALAMEIKNL